MKAVFTDEQLRAQILHYLWSQGSWSEIYTNLDKMIRRLSNVVKNNGKNTMKKIEDLVKWNWVLPRKNWDTGYNAEPVNVMLVGNMTSGISNSITSISNSTSSQVFNVVLNLSPDVQVGKYLFVVSVNEIGTNDTKGAPLIINVQ